ncbi:hypothetical protein JXB41_02050 [Candidatus Woesearchaeota archaeon]|nr:hypothetical protein [Candidatus Woesearchaeota archaeon]
MKKGTIFALLGLLLVGIVAAAGTASAFGWHIFSDEENREKIRAAVENRDFNSWKQAMSEQLTEENFNKILERDEQRNQHRENMEAVMAAIEAGDYDAWKEAVADCPGEAKISELITEENFDRFVEMHNARRDGDFETAKEISEELGINMPGHGKMDRGVGRFPVHRFNMNEE